MVVAISTREKLIWSITSKQIRDNFPVFQPYMRYIDAQKFDFRGPKGLEPACRCPGCRRMTPVATATIDHIIPRSQLSFEVYEKEDWGGGFNSFVEIDGAYRIKREGGIDLIPFDIDMRAKRLHYVVQSDNRTLHCTKPYDNFEIDLDIMDVLENALENLQPMCAYCNSKKGNRA